jgi:integrin beta 3
MGSATVAGSAAAGVARPGTQSGRIRPGTPFDQPGGAPDPDLTGLARPGAHGVGEQSAAGLARPGLDDSPSGALRRPGVADPPPYGTARPGIPGEPSTGSVRRGVASAAVRAGHLAPEADLEAPPTRGTGQVAAARGTGRVAVASASAAVAVPSALDDGPATAEADDPAGNDAAGGGLGSELRQQLRTRRRLRVVTLVTLSVIVLVLLPLLFSIRATTRDPVFTSLDTLDVPGWAAQKVSDQSSGSRWCFIDCRFRERTAQSQQAFAATDKVYASALTTAGWLPWKVAGCPDQPIAPTDGAYSCWRRDEFTLDLWVRLPECAVDQVAANDPAVLPSTGPDGTVPKPPPGKCTGSTVSIKVQNAITDKRGTPDGEKPGLTGETPDPILSNDPLLEPTPSPS